MTKVLLIGGGGFIGARLARQCLAAGLAVRIADLALPAAGVDSPDGPIEYVVGDFDNPADLERMLDGVNVVVHLVHRAMLLGLDSSMVQEIERNVAPTVRLFDRCVADKSLRLVFVSSGGTVYGEPLEPAPICERAALRPISVYGTSKSMIEQVLGLYAAQRGLQAIVVRPGNAYGPGQQPFKGQGLIPTVMASALQGKPVTIYGDGSAVRDYIHVDDIARGILAAIQAGRAGETYNIGTGLGTSINALINEFIRPAMADGGVEIDLQYAQPRGVDVAYNVLDPTRLAEQCGFRAAIDLQAGIAETWDWIFSTYGGAQQR
ncbi:NAD-dependent epimerase/dehydratase family protein [Cupriavidus gilardii]|uniref:NAD-dependent epimerase/dehydratase family protein n=1 Tax=Cupriavidus gilardii TaxID=82541 RepID=UPI0007E48498|nr:NAD-dependent epimerase/dehydratase family protein [Cupriavidus gilardii]